MNKVSDTLERVLRSLGFAIVTAGKLFLPSASFRRLEAHLKRHADRSKIARSMLALLYMQFDYYPEARRELERLAMTDKTSRRLTKSLGEVCYKSGDYPAAIRYLDRVADSAPDGETLLFLGLSKMHMGDFPSAAERLQQAEDCGLRQRLLYHALGYCFFKLGEYEAAVGAYSRGISLDPKDETLRNEAACTRIAYANELLQQSERERAVIQLRKALEFLPVASTTQAIRDTLAKLGDQLN
jgi:tetratricopeptide (TPR) repeat protein